MLAVLGALLPGILSVAAEPAGSQSKPSAAELVQGIIDQESKIDSVRSIYLRFEGTWTRPAEAIAPASSNSRKNDRAWNPIQRRDEFVARNV